MEEEEEITRNRELIDQLQSAVVSEILIKQTIGSKQHSLLLELLLKAIILANFLYLEVHSSSKFKFELLFKI